MSEDLDQYSRLNRFEKRRKNTKWLSYLAILGVVLTISFIAIIVFSGGDDNNPEDTVADAETTEDNVTSEADTQEAAQDQEDEEATATEPDTSEEDQMELDADVTEDVKLEEIESDGENVINAFTGNWQPIPTNQEEPHEIVWEKNSEDWEEMMAAAGLATGLTTEDMIYLWVAGNGEQQVIATFSNSEESEHYRVFIAWIENQGWKPMQVEVLNENDQKYRFTS
ncbi:YrrS family protein [Paraliobacillus sediminis]|uniref:YrrS family protein n=1 Tax=Paraliobacillus sediminis TaxID=1885916 RepID=UPI000E3C486F|nr:YrrS family protein [Paraliobacillus sediminis]